MPDLYLFYQPYLPERIYLDAEESRHAVRVLRMVEGDRLELTDGKGFFYSAKITKADSNKCEFVILEKKEIKKENFHIHIAIAPTKNADRIEWFVEKVTEIGVDEISLILCKNSERKTINLDRLKKITISAMKQSHQAWLPAINPIAPYKEILSKPADQKFIAFVDAANPTQLKSVAQQKKKYLILIGPEGDFSKDELEQALQNGFEKVSLGLTTLRTETAGLLAVHTLVLAQSN